MHKLEDAGLGIGPFRCIDMFQMPNKETATMQDYQALPKVTRGGAGCCLICGTGLVYNYIIRDAIGDTFIVGCDCLEKINDVVLTKEMRAVRREKRDAAKIKQRAEERAARQAQWDIERAANRAELMKLYGELFERAAKVKSEFVDSVISTCKHYGNISEKQIAVIQSAIDRHEIESKRKNEFFGTVKARIVHELTVDKWIHLREATWNRASLWLCLMRDSEGRTFTYLGNCDAIPGEGETAKLKFTIKEHQIYNNVCQTVIQRPAKV